MEITEVSPANESVGVALETPITITFDEAVDPNSISSGNLVLITSASQVVNQGPGLEDLNPVLDDLLSSETFSGFVKAKISTEDNLTVKLIPDSPLSPDRLYRVVLSAKIVSNTIEAVVGDPGNTSTGSFEAEGPYTSDVDDTITITVVAEGVLGVATFTYHRASTGLTSASISTDRVVDIEDGIKVKFNTGTFVADDSWTFDVVEGTPLDDIYEFSFTTGSFTHAKVSAETPSFQIESREIEGLKRIDGVPSVNSGTLALASIEPSNQSSNIPLSTRRIILTFNKEIDPDSLDEAVIKVIMENLPLDERSQNSHEVKVTSEVSGKQLTLTFSG